MNSLFEQLDKVKGFHINLVEALNSKGIYNLFDLFHYFPKKYEDRSSLLKLSEALKKTQSDKDFITTIICRCERKHFFFFQNRKVSQYYFTDEEDEFIVNAYNPYQIFRIKEYYILSGKLKITRGRKITLQVSAYEAFDQEAIKSIHLGRIVPIYPGGTNINQKRIRNLIEKNISMVANSNLDYAFPLFIKEKNRFANKIATLKEIHFPKDFSTLKEAREALVYEEFYVVLRKMIKAEKEVTKKEKDRYQNEKMIYDFLATTPYQLTPDQEKTLREIIDDLKKDQVMNRLLQGDVGTGKTLLAFSIMYWAYRNGHQSVLMAPSEVLAQQHYENLKSLLKGHDVEILLLTGSHNKRYKESALIDLAYKEKLMIIGTHALIQKKVNYKNLKLVIIDEQHKFGVEQRKKIVTSGDKVDFLSMTATPIPRSLSILLFSDMKISFLRVKPNSSKKINCKLLLAQDKTPCLQISVEQAQERRAGLRCFSGH